MKLRRGANQKQCLYCSLVSVNKQMSVYYQNMQGLRTKKDSLYSAVLTCDYDIIALTETWLNENIFNAELFGSRY